MLRLLLALIPFLGLCLADLNLGTGQKPVTIASLLQKSEKSRSGKLFPVIEVVTFQNGLCNGTSDKTGTCFTAQECETKLGTASGSCASGYGVCCVFELKCGGQSSENNTFLVDRTATNGEPGDGACTYKICPASKDICRIRLDFDIFSIAGPATVTIADGGAVAVQTVGDAIGDCTTDSFTVTAPGKSTPPVICGTNTGQHMILDASSMCHLATFNLNGDAAQRDWRVTVRQFSCVDSDDLAGPAGCLQYFTGATGTITNFNYVDNGADLASTPFHLSNQDYCICVRREAGQCGICYVPSRSDAIADMNDSFGLSVSPDANIAQATMGAGCSQDFVSIPGAEAFAANFADGTTNAADIAASDAKFCGRFFSVITIDTSSSSICTKVVPFRIKFVTNDDEEDGSADADMNETKLAPAGTVGFSLDYAQHACA